MAWQDYFDKVERVLLTFSDEYLKNYYENKDNVIIDYKDIDGSLEGTYDNDKNKIILYNFSALPHELFHMSFRDKNKVGKKICGNKNLYYDNGVVIIEYRADSKVFHNKGLTEGFAEYLSRKCSFEGDGQEFNYFFTDLLISIHGEDILKYPLSNDPVGLLTDKRFSNIIGISRNLDNLDYYINCIIRLYELEKVVVKHNKRDRELLGEMIKIIKSSTISLFKYMISEYNDCNNPNITKEKFIEKLESFLNKSCYNVLFNLDSLVNLKQKIEKIISKEKKIMPKVKKRF